MQRRGYHSPAIKQDEKTTHIIMTPCERNFRIDIMSRTIDGTHKYDHVIKNVHVDEAIELANKEFQDEVQRQKANGPVTTEDTPPDHNGFAWSPLTSLKSSDFDLPEPKVPHKNPDIHGAEGGTGTHKTGALSTSYSRAGKSDITISPTNRNDDEETRTFSNIVELIGYIREQGTYNGYDLVHQNFNRQRFADLKIPYSHLSEGILTHGSFTNNSFAFGTHDGAHFSDSDFTDTSFHAASLKDAEFIGSTLHKVDFRNADLEGADFTGADMTGADLRGVDLSKLKVPLTEQQMQQCRHDYNDSFEPGYRASKTDPQKKRFNRPLNKGQFGSFVRNKAFKDQFKGIIDIEGQNVSETDFGRAKMPRALCTEAIMDGALFAHAELQHAEMQSVSMRNIILNRANLTDADMTLSNAYKAKLYNADLSGAICRGVNFTKAEMQGAIMHGTDLTGAKLDGADLRGVDLSKTIGLTMEQLRLAKLDKETKLPEHITFNMINEGREDMRQQRARTLVHAP